MASDASPMRQHPPIAAFGLEGPKCSHRIACDSRLSGDSDGDPGLQSLMLPVLKDPCAGEVRISDVVAVLGTKLALTDAELSELRPRASRHVCQPRDWAKSYTRQGRLDQSHERAYFEISERGRAVLATRPQAINVKFLDSFSELQAFREAAVGSPRRSKWIRRTSRDWPPDEVIRSASNELSAVTPVRSCSRRSSPTPRFLRAPCRSTPHRHGIRWVGHRGWQGPGQSGDGGFERRH